MKDYIRLINKDFTVVISGESMYPTLYPSEKVVCRKVNDKTKLKSGNIILFFNESEKRYMIHRIMKVIRLRNGESYYVTKDKNLIVDKYLVRTNDVRGVVWSIVI